MKLFKFLKMIFTIKDCTYCGSEAFYVCIPHDTTRYKKVYMCPECMRAIRFRENDFYKDIDLIHK